MGRMKKVLILVLVTRYFHEPIKNADKNMEIKQAPQNFMTPIELWGIGSTLRNTSDPAIRSSVFLHFAVSFQLLQQQL